MNAEPSCRILVVDDQPDHAEGIRRYLLQATVADWHEAGAPDGFILRPDDVLAETSSAALVAALRKGERCPYDVVICDINMDQKHDEGALAVLMALNEGKQQHAPCLLAMTQFMSTWDNRRREIESLSENLRVSVPCIVISKYKTLADVYDQEHQLDPGDWRDIVLRGILYRTDHKLFKQLRREAALSANVEHLGPFKAAFKKAKSFRDKSLVVVVSEPHGLQATFAEAFRRQVQLQSVVGFTTEHIERALFGGFLDLNKLGRGEARLLMDADDLVWEWVNSPETRLGQRLLEVNAGRIAASKNRTDEFCGLVLVSITPETEARILHNGGAPSSLYNSLPRVTLPNYAATRAHMGPLVDLLLKSSELRVDHLDRAVMAAYDWNLGFHGPSSSAAFAALRACIDWIGTQSESHDAPPGIVANELTQSPDGRRSVYARMEREALVLYILERLVRVHKEHAAQSAAAFLYYLVIATMRDSESERKTALARLWRQSGAFRILKQMGSSEVKPHMVEDAWPDRSGLTDASLYSARANKNTSTLERSTADKMLELLKGEFRHFFKRSAKRPATSRARAKKLRSGAKELGPVGRRILELLSKLKGSGRSDGARQLGVLDAPLLSTN
jgi:CheY-like chemotaxis protein